MFFDSKEGKNEKFGSSKEEKLQTIRVNRSFCLTVFFAVSPSRKAIFIKPELHFELQLADEQSFKGTAVPVKVKVKDLLLLTERDGLKSWLNKH